MTNNLGPAYGGYMCGVAGLFSGCAAAASCPVTSVLDSVSPSASHPRTDYRSPFDNWHQLAAVRTAPRRSISAESLGQQFFSPDLVPLMSHPLIRGLPEPHRGAVVTRHAYRYLDFTAALEHLVVNPVATAISRGSSGVELPDDMRLDAYKIYCDEAYHALFSADVSVQIQRISGIRPIDALTPYFMRRLTHTHTAHDPSLRALIQLLFVVCSEMLISGTLAMARPQAGVDSAVYETVRDHAQDEGRHHAYFAQFLRHLWGQLDPGLRRFSAMIVPSLAEAFMAPDIPAVLRELADYGFDDEQARSIAAEVYADGVVVSATADAARHLVRSFAEFGALDDEEVQMEFGARGLLGWDTWRDSGGRPWDGTVYQTVAIAAGGIPTLNE